MISIYETLVRPYLFKLAPENAQRLADIFISSPILTFLRPFFELKDVRLRITIAGLSFPNPIILAAGYDKNCALVDSLPKLGFGGVVAGTITKEAKLGNPRPRILRKIDDLALINSLGFPNVGLQIASERLMGYQKSTNSTPIIASVSGLSIDEITFCVSKLDPLVDAIELNISSPNTAGLKAFQEIENLKGVLTAVNNLRTKSLFVKMPRIFRSDRNKFFDLIGLCLEQNVDGIVLANTLPVQDKTLFVGHGGLSGYPLLNDTLDMVSTVRARIGEKANIIASGGIFSGENVVDMMRAGANAVQVYTGFVYGGPGFVKRVNSELLHAIELMGVSNVSDLVGQGLHNN